MKTFVCHCAWLLVLAAPSLRAEPLQYSGALDDAGAPAQGEYALRFSLYRTPAGGIPAVPSITRRGVAVIDGRFDTEVDFGLAAAVMDTLWLQVEVAGPDGHFEAVPGRTAVNSKAGSDACWSTSGNTGTLATRDFLGTTDNQAVVVKANGLRALAISPRPNAPNIIAGYEGNSFGSSTVGAVIAGGGNDPAFAGNEGPNQVLADFNTVSGGAGNVAGEPGTTYPNFATVAGGRINKAGGRYSFVAGGTGNWANGFASFAAGAYARVRGPNEGGSAVVGDAGTFVWADSQLTEFTSTGGNQFLVRAGNGVAFNGTPPRDAREMTVWGNGNIDNNVDIHLRPKDSTFGYSLVVEGANASNTNFVLRQTDGNQNSSERLRVDAAGDLRITGNAFKPGGGSWAASSDARLKRDIAPLDGALAALLQLRGVHFRYRAPDALRPAGVQTGFVAQEVAKVFPGWVGRDAQGYLTVAPRGFEALAVEALRELAEENAALQAANEALGARLARLEHRLEAGR